MVRYSVSAIPDRCATLGLAHTAEEAQSAAEGYAKAFLFRPDAPPRRAAEIEVYSSCERCRGQGRRIKGGKATRFPTWIDCPACKSTGIGAMHYFASLLRAP